MNRDLLDFVDAIAREKSVDLEVVFAAVEAALASASKWRISESGSCKPASFGTTCQRRKVS